MYTPNIPNDISKGFSKWDVPKQAFQNMGHSKFWNAPLDYQRHSEIGAFQNGSQLDNRGIPKTVALETSQTLFLRCFPSCIPKQRHSKVWNVPCIPKRYHGNHWPPHSQHTRNPLNLPQNFLTGGRQDKWSSQSPNQCSQWSEARAKIK